jgi:8-oxo-dGTP pyrophosphatase MutT (NUDIX family)
VGISVLLETNDGFIPLTRRGIETPVYPGMLYSPGGGPKEGQTSVEAILEEILEETGLEEGVHFSAEKLVMLAYISDSKHQGTDHERPELVGYLPLDISLKDVHRIRKTYLANRKVPEADVWAYDIVSSDKADVSGKVVYDGNQMCPPTEAALSHLVHFQNCQTNTDPDDAVAATKKFMDRVTMYERAVYHPPISRLTREL